MHHDPKAVRNRLLFAKRRLDELSKMGGGDFGIAPEEEKQQALQEFFFHLVGAIEFLAQTINDARGLSIPEEHVTPAKVCKRLGESDPIKVILGQLHPKMSRKQPLPKDPYSEEGSHFRIILFRNWVCHCGRNPFHFRRGATSLPPTSLFLDPRDREDKGSDKPAIEELTLFWQLVNDKCEQILDIL